MKHYTQPLLLTLLLILGLGFSTEAQNALHFDGNNDRVDCGTNASLNITGTTITLEAWIYPTGAFKPNVWEGCVINKNGAGDNGYMIRVGNSGQVNFNIGTGSWNEINSATGVVTSNNWHHIAGTYDGTTMRLYVDGVQVATGALSANIGSASNSLYLGEDPQWSGRVFRGRIEEVKIWNTTRSAAEVLFDMNNNACTPYPAGLVAYYKFNQGIASGGNAGLTTVIDETGVNNGTLINSSLNGFSSNWTVGLPEFCNCPTVPTFTLSATNCNTASATITGDTGGTFAFNPAPGDGAIIDANTGEITNGVPGNSYTVEYTTCASTSSTESITLPLTGNSAFGMSITCGGAYASITGDQGGTFAFNPVPGDGAQINATTGTVSNGTAGNSYTVEYTICGSTTAVNFTVTDDNCWTLNGDAQYITVNGEQCIQLTDEINNQTGCAWNQSQIDFASNFTLTLDYYFGDNIGGADGNTFTFQPSSSTACGSPGGQLGAGGLTNALSIEFDTYDNDNPTHLYDLACDHIAVEIDGSHQFAAPLCGAVCAKAGGGNIDDGGVYQVDIEWIQATNTLNIYFDGVLRLFCVNDFVTNAFGGASQVYWGATSATGGLNNQQYFCPSTIIILPVELTSFDTRCNGDIEVFSWTTASEDRVDYFQLEYTYDGMVFIPVGQVDAIGTSQSEQDYNFEVSTEDPKQRYYRLKIVDENGEFKYTDLISSKRCAYSNELISEVKQSTDNLTIRTNEETTITVVNQLGQVLYSGQTQNQTVHIDKRNFADGIYFVAAQNAQGLQESKKIFIRN